MREPVDDWNDEYQEQFLTLREEDMLLDKVEDMIQEDLQSHLADALQLNVGYKGRQEDLMACIDTAEKHGNFAPFGEYLYLMLVDYVGEEAKRELGL